MFICKDVIIVLVIKLNLNNFKKLLLAIKDIKSIKCNENKLFEYLLNYYKPNYTLYFNK